MLRSLAAATESNLQVDDMRLIHQKLNAECPVANVGANDTCNESVAEVESA